MINLGKVRPGSTLRVPFGSFAATTGAPSAVTNYADADILVYKDGSTTQRASAAGITATTTFDTLTGVNLLTIDLADNTTADFWASGSEYIVVVSDITVDAQTLRFPIARFVIGIEGEIFATTIATLASQTSFTLTAGSADNSAYVGSVVYIHDAASAIQCAMGVVSAYTGSTKTVTLAADPAIFTIAAKDNISIMPRTNVYQWNGLTTVSLPLSPTTAGRTLDVSAGGEAGVDWANVGSPTTAVNLSATNIDVDQVVASVSGAVGSVTGAVGSVTGAVGSVTGAVGSVTGNVGGNVTGSVGSVTGLTNATIADAVWDEDATAHQTQGTFGQAIGDPGADTDTIFGLVNTNLDAAVSTRLSTAGYTAPDNTSIAAILVDTAEIGVAGAGLTNINLPDQTMNITGDITGNLSGSVGSVTGAVGSVTGNVGGSVASVVGAVGSVTGLTAANLDVAVSTRMATYTQPTGFLAATFPLTVASTTNIAAGTITTVTNLTNAPTSGDLTATMKASVNTEVLDVLNTDTFAEPGQEAPPATTTLVKKIGYIYKMLRNKITQTSTTLSVFADDATTVDQKATVSDDGTTYTRGEIGSGP